MESIIVVVLVTLCVFAFFLVALRNAYMLGKATIKFYDDDGNEAVLVSKEKMLKLEARVRANSNRLNYLNQLRPLIPADDKYSKYISFEQMSEYALLYMQEHGLIGEQEKLD